MHSRSITDGFAGRHSAQALVEFALILPVMLVLVLGSIDIGRALVYGVAVQEGAREAARLGTTAGVDSAVTDTVVLQRLIDGSKPALGACLPITTRQPCGGGWWTFTLKVDTATPNTWNVLNTGGVGARTDPDFSGSTLTVTALGEVSIWPGNGFLFPLTAQGQAVLAVV